MVFAIFLHSNIGRFKVEIFYQEEKLHHFQVTLHEKTSDQHTWINWQVSISGALYMSLEYIQHKWN